MVVLSSTREARAQTPVIDGPPPPVPPEVITRGASGQATVRAIKHLAPLSVDGRRGGATATPMPFTQAPNMPASDLPALARSGPRAVQAQARTAAGMTASSPMVKAHWLDVVDRVSAILEPARR